MSTGKFSKFKLENNCYPVQEFLINTEHCKLFKSVIDECPKVYYLIPIDKDYKSSTSFEKYMKFSVFKNKERINIKLINYSISNIMLYNVTKAIKKK